MKKKLLVLAAVFLLMFSFAGQAMAAFSQGDLIQVIFTTDGNGAEVATDLGSFTHTTSTGVTDNSLSNTVNMSNFSGYSASGLSVGYFVFNTTGTAGYWLVSTDESGLTSNANTKISSTGSFTNVINYYKGLAGSGSVAIGSAGNDNSYYGNLQAGFSGVTGVAGEVTLPSSGSVDQYLYYFTYSNGSTTGTEVADIRTFADGHTEIIPVSSVPIPAAVWLLGSGLIGLVGIRRRETAA